MEDIMKYRLAIFDLDGTILNTLDDLADAVNYALVQNELPARTIEEIRHFVGNGIRLLIERAMSPISDKATVDKVHKDFTAYYKEHCADKTAPYEGILELIEQIRHAGMKTAVVSNKADYGVQTLMKDYFPGLFDMAVGERAGIAKKPSPDSVYEVLEKLGVDRSEAVYIGDSEVDLETAQNACLDVIMVGWGFRDKEFLYKCGAKTICDNTDEVSKLLEI